MTKFSIIVPVYNVEKYLPKCLDSLVNQTYKDIEIICINDGSTDNSLQILEKYAINDNRIKIINQENQGVSIARNVGIDNATGDYILFLDSDDCLELDACQKIVEKLDKDIDILFFGYKFLKNYKSCKICSYPDDMNNKKYISPINLNICINKLSCRTVWGKVYKTKRLKDLNIKFPTNLNFGEDTLFIISNLINNSSIKVINDVLYNYRTDNNNSLTKIDYKKQLDQLLILIKEFDLLFSDKNIDEKLKLYIYDDTFYLISLLWSLYLSKYKKDFVNTIDYIQNFYSQYDKSLLLKLKGYKRIQLYTKLQKYHLMWLYLYIVRPIGKYCIVLPYRRIKQILRGKNV